MLNRAKAQVNLRNTMDPEINVLSKLSGIIFPKLLLKGGQSELLQKWGKVPNEIRSEI